MGAFHTRMALDEAHNCDNDKQSQDVDPCTLTLWTRVDPQKIPGA